MDLHPLTAISPIDGRYRNQLQHLGDYFSEYALIKYRVLVEIEYLLLLSQKGYCGLPQKIVRHLNTLKDDFTIEQAQEIKEIEKTTNHDVKAVEYFLKRELENAGAGEAIEWVHFGLTSQDVNNTAIPLLWKHAVGLSTFLLSLT
jgi:adenylosuccinate lyase